MLIRLLFIAAIFFVICFSPGCQVYESLESQKAMVQQLQQEKSTLQKQAIQVDAAAQVAQQQARELQERENIIRQNIAQVSQQLATAVGPAYDAIEQILDQMRQQRRELQGQAQAAADQAAQYAALQAQTAAQIALTDDALTQSAEQITALEAKIKSQSDDVGNLITQVGDSLQSVGVPGAAPIANEAANIWGGVAGLVGMGIAAFMGKKKKTADQAASELAESFQMAKQQSPQFKQAFDNIKGMLKSYQGKAAQAVVEKAKAAIPEV